MRRIIGGVLLVLLAGLPLSAQQLSDPVIGQLDQLLGGFDRSAGPGCAVAVVQGGVPVYRRALGMGQLDLDIPLSTHSVFYVASLAKQFTAAATLVAIHEGYIDPAADIHRYLPELPFYGAPITVDHLMHHTSGIPDFLLSLLDEGIPWENILTDSMMLQRIIGQPELDFPTGTAIKYSNSGYALLAEIIHRTTGRSLDAYARERLFAPLGMTETTFHDDHTKIVPGRIFSYDPGADGTWRTNYNMNFDRVGGGGLYSSLEDLIRWDAAFRDGLPALPGFADRMYRRGTLSNGDSVDYASGLGIGIRDGRRRVAHGGGFMAFRTMMVRYPEAGVSVIILCNDGGVDATALSLRIEDLLFARVTR